MEVKKKKKSETIQIWHFNWRERVYRIMSNLRMSTFHVRFKKCSGVFIFVVGSNSTLLIILPNLAHAWNAIVLVE